MTIADKQQKQFESIDSLLNAYVLAVTGASSVSTVPGDECVRIARQNILDFVNIPALGAVSDRDSFASNLQEQILRIRLNYRAEVAATSTTAEEIGYMNGHLDARHSAAELVRVFLKREGQTLDHNFSSLMRVQNMLLERDLLVVDKTEETHGPFAAAMNIVTSIEKALSLIDQSAVEHRVKGLKEAAELCAEYTGGWYAYKEGAKECANAIRMRISLSQNSFAPVPVPFVVGNQYQTYGGTFARLVSVHNEGSNEETMLGDDGVARYTRCYFGRVEGSPFYDANPRSLIPLHAHQTTKNISFAVETLRRVALMMHSQVNGAVSEPQTQFARQQLEHFNEVVNGLDSEMWKKLILNFEVPQRSGWKFSPVHASEEMIQVGCLRQSDKNFDSYQDWEASHSTGVVGDIRLHVAESYTAMVLHAPRIPALSK